MEKDKRIKIDSSMRYMFPFAGYPICVLRTGFQLNDNELNFIKNLEYKNNEFHKITESTNILQLNELQILKDFIENSLDDYVSNVLEINNKFNLTHSWATIQNEKQFHQGHTHCSQLISSVYYAEAEKPEITFKIPKSKLQEGYYFSYDIKNNNIYNSSGYTVTLKKGDIIFFPGQLHHETPINNKKERIIVGSGFFIEGNIGQKIELDDLNIKILNDR